MRYPPEHKAAARQKLITAGGALAKKSGFNSTGMDALAASAEMTTGAFYNQFSSKKEFLSAIIDHELTQLSVIFATQDEQGLRQALAWYLSPQHVEHPEKGCLLPSLGAEIGRADESTRMLFEQHLEPLITALQSTTHDKAQAWTLLAQAIGGIILARAVLQSETQQEILQSVKKFSFEMIKPRP
ncbi:MAG: TetR/AcrR family transcriptional regulator [Agitococcus sp.]